MKNLLLIAASMLLIACSTEDYNQSVEPKTDVYQTHTPVPSLIIGEYKAVEGRVESNTGKPLETGTVSITKDVIDVNLSVHKFHLELNEYTTLANLIKDCFYDIYLPDGRVIRVSYAWLQSNGEIWLMVDGVIYAILKPVGSTEPTPIEPEPTTPEIPVNVN